ncbi:MAG TPA: hypothetical protein PKJ68_05375 [Candidatus Woesebacteria bacterium]|jgi:hypothetical protein|nr:hypothetical protein [Candidatus Woesebacteria bacterium]
MPVYQVYFPAVVSSDIEDLAKSLNVTAKEFVQAAVGEKIKRTKDEHAKKNK